MFRKVYDFSLMERHSYYCYFLVIASSKPRKKTGSEAFDILSFYITLVFAQQSMVCPSFTNTELNFFIVA